MPEITDKLFNSVNETAKVARTSLLFFLVVALYLLIIVGTTTDLMLLRGEVVALPLMEVGVPVVAFYSVAPLIFLLLHSNLLLRLCQLTETVSNSKEQEDEYSSLVFPLDFARLLLGGKIHWALYTVVVTQIYILPIVVLLALQMSFLAYQSSGITAWHQLIITFDLVLLFLFVCFVRGTRAEEEVDRDYVLKMLCQRSEKFLVNLVLISAGLVLILAWTIAVVPNGWQETVGIFVAMLVGLFFLLRSYVSKRLRNKQDNELNKFFLPTKFIVRYGVILLFFLGIVAIAVDVLQEHKTVKWSERTRLGIVTNDADGSQERSIQQQLLACLRQLSACVFADWWEGYPITSYRPVRRFLNVAEQPIALKEAPPEIVSALIIKEEDKLNPLCKYIGELDLSGRQLNYAYFYGSQFRCVKLEFAELHGANLSNAKLHGVDFRWTELHGADLGLAKLHGANLSNAKLHGADLYNAKLHGADLEQAELHGADLFKAELHGADLSEAELHGADFRWTELHGADLRLAELHGADLRFAELYGADLGAAELCGANLRWAKLHGVDLGQVILKNTDLSDARWDKPKYDWDIISNIRNGLKIRELAKKQGLTDDEINDEVNRLVSRIERISSVVSGFIPPMAPIATDCVFHLEFIPAVVEVACRNQWTARGIVNRAIYRRAIYGKKDINLITALHDKDCSSLDPYRKALNDKHKELIQ